MPYDSILKALTGDAENDLASNPWFTGGSQAVKMDPSNPYEPAWKNILAKSLLNFGGSFGQGFGKSQAEKAATERQNSVLSALSSSDPSAEFQSLSLKDPSFSKYGTLYGIEDANNKAALRQKMNDLRLTTRFNKFVDVDPSGNVVELPGAADALGSIEGTQEAAKARARNMMDLEFSPQIEGAKTQARLSQELNYQPKIDAAKQNALINKPLTQKEIKDLEVRARNEISGSQPFKNVFAIKPILDSMKKSLDDPSAAGDLDFVYGTGKILDPGSAVLGGEMKLTQNIDSKSAQLLKSAERMVISTGFLSREMKQKLYDLAERRYKASVDSYRSYAKPIVEAEERSGGNRANMLILPLEDEAKDYSQMTTEELKALRNNMAGG